MKKIIILFSSFIFLQQLENKVYSQGYTIYNNGGITVELIYAINDPCTNGVGKTSKFSYRITGTPKGYDFFLNWKMDYYNCNGRLIRQTNFLNLRDFVSGALKKSDNWTFAGSRILTYYDSVYTSGYPDQTASYERVPPKSEPAKSILGNLYIDYGEETTLTQNGGTLGVNASWKWYSNNCGGNFITEHESVKVSPTQTTEYFVRAEGPNGNTACYSVKVVVNRESRAANSIDGRKLVCKGESASLSVNGGKLGEAADWIWYQDRIGGTSIGKGAAISVSPSSTTTYFVRAEGLVNTTAEKSITIKAVEDKLQDPKGISAKSNVCSGSNLSLQVTGGLLSEGAEWCWYKNSISAGNLLGKGETVNTKIYTDVTFYVRGEGVCKMTGEKSILITVSELSQTPASITGNTGRLSKRKATLYVNGGVLGYDANWKWYKGSCSGRSIGTGKSITVRPKKNTTYYVRAEGNCNTTSCASATVMPTNNLKHFFINFGVVPNFHSISDKNIPDFVNESINQVSDNPVVALTFGAYKISGWYFRGKYSIKSQSSDFTIQNNEVVDQDPDNYYLPDGSVAENRWSATVGWIRKLNRNSLFFQLGAGYGKRDLLWGVKSYSNLNNSLQKSGWGKITTSSFSGIEVETGLMLRVLVFNIMVGVNGIVPLNSNNGNSPVKDYKTYVDAHLGFGFTF